MSLFAFSGRSGYKWFLLVILFVTFFLEQGARQVYNITIPLIKADFAGLGVSDVQIGAVGTAFTFVFGIGLLLAGAVSDLLSRKLVLIGGTLLFSLGILGTGFANGIAALLLFGVARGIWDANYYPAFFDFIPQKFRSASVGVCGCMAFVIGSAAPSALGWISDHMSLRIGLSSLAAFCLVGMAVVCVVRIFTFKRHFLEEGEGK